MSALSQVRKCSLVLSFGVTSPSLTPCDSVLSQSQGPVVQHFLSFLSVFRNPSGGPVLRLIQTCVCPQWLNGPR
jgi:hypothetical protein